jgi:hypothetical protein
MKLQYGIAVIALLLIIILSFGWCSERRSHLADFNKMSTAWANDTVRLKRVHDSKDSITRYEMEQKIGTYKNAAVVAGDEAKKYKSLLAVVKAKVGAGKTNIVAEYTSGPNNGKNSAVNSDSLTAATDTGRAQCIPVGTAFAYSDKWFYIGGSLGAENVLIDSTGFYPGTMKVIIGNKKGGLFKRQQPTISLMFENPNMYAHTANNIIVQDKRKPKRLLWFLAGAAAGFIGGVLTP